MMNRNKKGLFFKTGLNYIFFKITNYLAWIANLGVVPLFLLAAFLLAPAFFFLIALLLVVTLVLETMIKLLSQKLLSSLNFFKKSFLPIIGLSVKGFVIALSVTPLCNNAYAVDEEQQYREIILLSQGEIKEIPLLKLKNYQITNKEILQYRFDGHKENLKIKGKKPGETDLIVHFRDKEKTFKVIVIPKKNNVSTSDALKFFYEQNIIPEFYDNKISLTGKISNLDVYFKTIEILKNSNQFTYKEIEIETTLKNEILALVLSDSLKLNLVDLKCNFENLFVQCLVPADIELNLDSYNSIKLKYAVQFLKLNEEKKNLKIKLKFIQLEQLDGLEIGLGLDHLDTTLDEVLNSSLLKVIGKNQVILKENKIDLSTLAEPELILIPNKEVSLELGNQTPFTVSDKNQNQHTTWHFSGLRLKLKINQSLDNYLLEFQTELTKENFDQNQSTSGSKSTSFALVTKNNPLKLFEVNMKTIGKNQSGLPFLSRLPLIGEIFKSKSDSNNYKRIYAIAEISE